MNHVQADAWKRTGGGWDVLVRSKSPPGAALWHGAVAGAELTPVERREVEWGARQGGFDAAEAVRVIREAVERADKP